MHDFLLGIFTDGYHAVGTPAGTAELEVVYLPVYPMIVLGSMDKDEVVNGDDVFASLAASLHLSLLGSSDVERKLVAQAMEDLDAVLLYIFCDTPNSPERADPAPYSLGRKMEKQVLECWYLLEIGHAMRLGSI